MKRTIVTLALGAVAGLPASAQVATPIPPQTLDWHGDPKAPNISGVWVRDDAASRSAASREGWAPWPPPSSPRSLPYGASGLPMPRPASGRTTRSGGAYRRACRASRPV